MPAPVSAARREITPAAQGVPRGGAGLAVGGPVADHVDVLDVEHVDRAAAQARDGGGLGGRSGAGRGPPNPRRPPLSR